jgi:hypothetical protein
VFYWRHKEQLGKRSDSMLASLGITLGINLAYSMINRRIDNWWAARGAGEVAAVLPAPGMLALWPCTCVQGCGFGGTADLGTRHQT